ncbi:hypothetical protein ACOSQ2_012786 [Xanthoceras sorbifolium]
MKENLPRHPAKKQGLSKPNLKPENIIIAPRKRRRRRRRSNIYTYIYTHRVCVHTQKQKLRQRWVVGFHMNTGKSSSPAPLPPERDQPNQLSESKASDLN